MNPEDFQEYYDRMAHIYNELELELFEMIIKRLMTNSTDGKDYVLEWQATRLLELNALNQEALLIISEFTGIAIEEVQSILEEAVNGTVQSVDDELAGILPKPPTGLVAETTQALADQTFLELDNLVNQTLITTAFGQGEVERVYRRIVEETTAKVLAGNRTIDSVIAETVIKWREQGLKSGFVDRGGRRWNAQVYAATVVKNTVNRTYNQLRIQRMEEYGVDLVVVDVFSDARRPCARCQGKVITTKRYKEGYQSIYDFQFAEPAGFRGVNCRHSMTPFVEGVNKNNLVHPPVKMTDEQFKLSQEQRYLERQVRKAKESLQLAEITGDETQINRYKQLIRNRQLKLREFVKENNTIRRYENERVI